MKTRAPWWDRIGWAGALALCLTSALVAYRPLLAATTGLLWDDAGHVTAPALRSLHGLWRIWFDIGATQQYYPVTHSAFWLQARLWGDALGAYHVVNVVLHAVSATLLWRILRRVEIPGALLSAVVFAVHPVMVESVAWISELKNTLSCVFFLTAGLAYLEFDDRRHSGGYLAALMLFGLAVLSKSVTATLPIGLLIVVWWRRGRVAIGRDLLPLAPFVAIAVAAGSLTVRFEAALGASGEEFALSFVERTLVAGRAVWFYLASLAWPAHLTFNYPRWPVDAGAWWQYLFPASLAVVLAGLWIRRARGALAALLLYGVTLAPALGFVNVYPHRFSFVADHFQYHASIAIIAAAGAAIAAALARAGRHRWQGAAFLVAVPLALVTSGLSRQYTDEITLYRATIARNPDSWLAHNNLAAALVTGTPSDVREAAAHAQQALRLKPGYPEAQYNLGVAYQRLGDFDAAVREYRATLAMLSGETGIDGRLSVIHRRLGASLSALGRTDESVQEFALAIALDPSSADAHADLGVALGETGRTDAALPYLRDAVRLAPTAPNFTNLGGALLRLGRMEEAATSLSEAVRLDPSLVEAHYNLGAAYAAMGRYREAASAYREVVRLAPADAQARAALAAALARVGRTP